MLTEIAHLGFFSKCLCLHHCVIVGQVMSPEESERKRKRERERDSLSRSLSLSFSPSRSHLLSLSLTFSENSPPFPIRDRMIAQVLTTPDSHKNVLFYK